MKEDTQNHVLVFTCLVHAFIIANEISSLSISLGIIDSDNVLGDRFGNSSGGRLLQDFDMLRRVPSIRLGWWREHCPRMALLHRLSTHLRSKCTGYCAEQHQSNRDKKFEVHVCFCLWWSLGPKSDWKFMRSLVRDDLWFACMASGTTYFVCEHLFTILAQCLPAVVGHNFWEVVGHFFMESNTGSKSGMWRMREGCGLI